MSRRSSRRPHPPTPDHLPGWPYPPTPDHLPGGPHPPTPSNRHDRHSPDVPAGVIFDLDGTLVASEVLYATATEQILAPLGRSLRELTPEERSRIPGRAAVENMEFYRRKFGLEESAEDLVRSRVDRIIAMVEADGVRVIPGTREFLEDLSTPGVGALRLALASSASSRYVLKVLARTGLAPFFEVVKTGDDCARVKPDPEIFLAAADGLGLPPSRCLVVEDAHSGILAARAAGMKVLAVRSDYTLPEQSALADRVVEDFRGLGRADVLALLDGGA